MNIEHHTLNSNYIGVTELKVYGSKGRPLIVFPTSKGRFFDFENFGMVEALQEYIKGQNLMIFTVDSVDSQSWFNQNISPAEKASCHVDYDKFIYNEVIPFIRSYDQAKKDIIVSGCDFGAYHAANFFFRHPDVVNGLIALSGTYSVDFAVNNYIDDNVYFNDPLLYLPNLKDPWYIDKFNDSDIIICSGQGAFEDISIKQSRALSSVLGKIGVKSHWLDLWGYDVVHDWFWWRKQIVYFLGHLKKRPLID